MKKILKVFNINNHEKFSIELPLGTEILGLSWNTDRASLTLEIPINPHSSTKRDFIWLTNGDLIPQGFKFCAMACHTGHWNRYLYINEGDF